MNEERKLTWKYFFEQKWEEISEPLYCAILVACIISFLYTMVTANDDPMNWQFYVASVFAVIIVLVFLLWVSLVFCIWIRDNWRLATKRAKQDMKETKK